MPRLLYNKKIHFDYEVLEEIEAGIELFGTEVKSLKSGKGRVEGSHITIRGGEAFVIGMSIPPYQAKNTALDYNPERNRRLLLTKKELSRLTGLERQKGLTIVPISVYNKGKRLKMGIVVVRGKKKYDKRETLKKRDVERDLRRTLKN